MENWKYEESQLCSAKDGLRLHEARLEADRKVKQWELAQVAKVVAEIQRAEKREALEAQRHEELMNQSPKPRWCEIGSLLASVIGYFKI